MPGIFEIFKLYLSVPLLKEVLVSRENIVVHLNSTQCRSEATDCPMVFLTERRVGLPRQLRFSKSHSILAIQPPRCGGISAYNEFKVQ